MFKGIEQRNETRVNVKIILNVERIKMYNKDIDLPKPFSINVENVSCSGMLFLTKLDIPKNMIFYLNFFINNNIISVTSEIVWKSYKNGQYKYGCKFFDIDYSEEQLLRKFIYDEQLKIRRSEKKHD